MLILNTFRSLIFAERIAILEVLLPMLVIWISFYNGKYNKLFRFVPLIAIVFLFIFFGIFEYFRSWIYYKNYYDGTDHEEYSPYWWFSKEIRFPKEKQYRGIDIDFIVKIPKDGSDLNIMVLDMDFCQPYDYQRILSKNPNHPCASIVNEQVERWMEYLQEQGVLSGHVRGEYI